MDDVPHKLGTRGEEEEQFAPVTAGIRRLILDEMADLLRKPCPARFTCQDRFNALMFKRLLKPLDLGGFSAPFPAFKRDELSPCHFQRGSIANLLY